MKVETKENSTVVQLDEQRAVVSVPLLALQKAELTVAHWDSLMAESLVLRWAGYLVELKDAKKALKLEIVQAVPMADLMAVKLAEEQAGQ